MVKRDGRQHRAVAQLGGAVGVRVAPSGASDEYVAAAIDALCARLEEGDTYRRALRVAGVEWGDVQVWIRRRPDGEDIANRVARARASGAALWADRAVEVAEEATNQDVAVARLRSQVYQWRAGVQNPKDWGNQQAPTRAPQITVQVAYLGRPSDSQSPDGDAR